MNAGERHPEHVIERALVRIRRDQQNRRLQRRAAGNETGAVAAENAARFRYLDALEDAGESLAISQIAEAIDVDRPRASRLTGELLADGLIERDTDPGDSRYVLIRLTAQGRELVDHVHRSRRRAVAEALAGFTEEEALALATLLERFVDAWPRERPRS
ncbi:MAG TPA: MarR family transcriptional regulator [Glycomyces sp.]|nr:MarR family transcriptional regulator [Glycomyces sp.]